MRRPLAALVVLAVTLGAAPRVQQDAPFPIAASTGSQAGSRIDATVTRVVDGKRETLQAAVVPRLLPGDVVDVRFTDYLRPPAPVNYHVNVAFLTETAPQHWLYPASGPADRLFSPPVRDLHFTYGGPGRRGIPIFFIAPEDRKTHGMDGLRAYVDAHPTGFVQMAVSSNEAVDRYAWFEDFLGALAGGSLNPIASQHRVEDIAASLGASPVAIDECYTAGGTSSEVANCIESTVQSTAYATNLSAPTEAQFFGGLAGAAAPVQLATFLVPLLTVWKIFMGSGRQEYEYLPTTLRLAAPPRPGAPSAQLLMGSKIPALRPPAAVSDALFFTIGDPQAAATPPIGVDDAPAGGVCAASARVPVPLHLDRTSAFVHDAALVVTPDGRPSYRVPLNPQSVAAPLVARTAFAGASDGGYTVRLAARFGFDPIAEPERVFARLAVPGPASWSVAPAPHRPPRAGDPLDVIATSPQAPCLARAELQVGSAPPVALDVTALDGRRVELRGALKGIPAGDARLRFYEITGPGKPQRESDVALAIAPSPASVEGTPVAYLGDRAIAVTGSALQTIAALRIGGVTYAKDPGSDAATACFSGPPLGGALEPGEQLSAQLVPRDGSAGEIFPLAIAAARPSIAVSGDGEGEHPSSAPLALTVTSSAPLPAARELRIRRARPAATPCEAFAGDDAADAVVAQADTYEASPTALAVTLRPDAALRDRAFGTLALQLVDTATKAASDWVPIPGTFVRVPAIRRIACPADPSAPCAAYGTGLDAIAGVAVDGAAPVAPLGACAAGPAGEACLLFPHGARFTLRLRDTATPYPAPSPSAGG